jgi:hypothetical protein
LTRAARIAARRCADGRARSREPNDVLERWWKRFQFALGYWNEPPQEKFREHYEAFNDLVVILVTASFIEGLLYVGVQFAGFDVKPGRKAITLWPLITKALEFGVIDGSLAALLYRVNDMRNGAAHDPDYHLTDDEVGVLYELLPDADKDRLQPAFRNILPEPTADVVARLTFERIVATTYESVRSTQQTMLAAMAEGESNSGSGELS